MKKTSPGANPTLRAGIAVAVLVGGALFASAPADADQFGVSIGVGAVGFSYSSGGYCDDYGCPTNYWDDPVYYCPVYYRHRWYRGPVYYARRGGGTYFWIHHGWRRDEWGGPRPGWACNDRYGPPLDLYFYQSSGFRVRDAWWNSWGREHNDWYWRDHPDWNRNQNFGGRIAQGQEWDRARSWTGVSHPWASARGQGFEQGGQRGGAMGVNPSQSSGAGSQGGDQGMPHHRAGAGGQGSDQGAEHHDTGGASQGGDQGMQHRDAGAGGQSSDQGTQHHGAEGRTPPGSSMAPSGGQGNEQPGNMSGSGATQSPQSQGGPDQGSRHHGKPSDASTGNQGNSGNAGGGDSGSGRAHDNQSSGQGQGAPNNSGNDDQSAGKKHGDRGGDQNTPNDNGNGNPH